MTTVFSDCQLSTTYCNYKFRAIINEETKKSKKRRGPRPKTRPTFWPGGWSSLEFAQCCS
eukprot:9135148-Karenia_brevis.AAC.1